MKIHHSEMNALHKINLWVKKQTHDQINLEEHIKKVLRWYLRMFLYWKYKRHCHTLGSWCGSHFSGITTSSLPYSIHTMHPPPQKKKKHTHTGKLAPTFPPKSILCLLNVWNWGGISVASMQKCARKLSLIGGQGYRRCVCKSKCKDTL